MEHISQKHGNAILLETCNDTFSYKLFVFMPFPRHRVFVVSACRPKKGSCK